MNFKLLKGKTRWVFILSACLSLAQCSKPRNEKNIKGLVKTLLYGLFYGGIQKNTIIDSRNLIDGFNSEYEENYLPNIKNIFGEDADCNDFSIVGGRSGEELYTNGPFEYYFPYNSPGFASQVKCPRLSVSLLGVNEKKISQETILGGDDIHLVYYNLPCGDVLFSNVFGTPNDDKINAVVGLSFLSLTNTPTMDPTIDPTTDPTTDPIADPTSNPTTDPIADPTSNPTSDPTSSPTASTAPTRHPTKNPTKNPIPRFTTTTAIRPRLLDVSNTQQQLYEDYQASNINFFQGLCWTETDKDTKKQIAHNSIIAPVMDYDEDYWNPFTIDKKYENTLKSENGDSTCEEAVAFFPSMANYPLMVSTGFYDRYDNNKNKVYLKILDPVLHNDKCLKIITLAKNIEIINSKITSIDNDSILISISSETSKGNINSKFIIFDYDCSDQNFEQYKNFPLVHHITSLRQDQQNPILYPQLQDANYPIDTFNTSQKYKGLVYGVASKDSKAIVFILNTTNELEVDCLKYVDNDILYKDNNDMDFVSSRVLYQVDLNATYIGNIGKFTNNDTVVAFTNALNCRSINNESIIISENDADNWKGKLILQQRIVNSMIDVNITDPKYITVFSNYNIYNNTDSITGVSFKFSNTDNFLPTNSCYRFVEGKYIELKNIPYLVCKHYDDDCIEHKVSQNLNIAKNNNLSSINNSMLITCDICSNSSTIYSRRRRFLENSLGWINSGWVNSVRGLVCKRPMCKTKKGDEELSAGSISAMVISIVAAACLYCCCCCLYFYCCLRYKIKRNAEENNVVRFSGIIELEE